MKGSKKKLFGSPLSEKRSDNYLIEQARYLGVKRKFIVYPSCDIYGISIPFSSDNKTL